MITPANPNVSQPPLATPFQPGGANERTGTSEQKPRPKTPQPSGAAAAESQEAAYVRTKNEQALDRRQDNAARDEAEVSARQEAVERAEERASRQRGSNLDVRA